MIGKPKGKRFRQNRHPLMRTVLALDLIVVFLPLVIMVAWCFARVWTYPSLIPQEWSLRGWETALSMNPDLPRIVLSSIGISLVVALLSTALSLFVARAIAFYDFKGKHVVDFLTMLPLMVSATALGMGLHVFMLRHGLANSALGVVLVHLIIVLPYGIKMLADPLRIMGSELSESARNMGASPLQAFFHVELAPLLPTLVAATSLAFIVSFGQYFLTLIIGGGKVITLAIVMVPWITSADRTLAATYAVIYLVATLAVFLAFDLIERIVSKNRKTYLM